VEPYHLVRFAGHLDVSRYPEFRSAFIDVPHGVPTLIDLTLVESVDSTFLSEMLLFKRRHEGNLATLIQPTGHVARLFEIANIGEKLSVYSDLSAAVGALGLSAASEAARETAGGDELVAE
jgi:anti-anti-sigma regulatory factor